MCVCECESKFSLHGATELAWMSANMIKRVGTSIWGLSPGFVLTIR